MVSSTSPQQRSPVIISLLARKLGSHCLAWPCPCLLMSRSSQFLKCFWDLASDVSATRMAAIDQITSHLSGQAHQDDLDYSLKRLVKGLSSSRDSARLGFSSCLTIILTTHTNISLESILSLSDENTIITGSSRGMDEREMIFGKLFCYLSILRSGRVNEKSNANFAMTILERILAIHEMRGWIRELTTEAMLCFLSAVSKSKSICTRAMEKMEGLLSEEVHELSAWQIVLLMGLRPYQSYSNKLQLKLESLDFQSDPRQTLDTISDALMSATSGFPKIHRVWECLIGEVFPFDDQRMLPTTR